MNNDIDSLKAAAINGDVEAQFELGRILSHQKKYDVAFSWFQKASDKGYIPAMRELGKCYLNGFSGEQDCVKAFGCFSKASKGGDDEGTFYLAQCYFLGKGADKDENHCFDLMEALCKKGNTSALNFQARIFQEKYNKDKAIEYLKLAIANGASKDASEKLAKLENSGDLEAPTSIEDTNFDLDHILFDPKKKKNIHISPKPSAKAPLCFNWYKRKAEEGNAMYMFFLGNCYENGFGTAVDEKAALSWYKKAADNGNVDAKCAIGTAQLYGRLGLKADKDNALETLSDAADLGSIEAMLLRRDLEEDDFQYEFLKRYKGYEVIEQNGKFGWTNHKYEYQKPIYDKVIITDYAIATFGEKGTRVFADLYNLADFSFPFQDEDTGMTGWKDVFGNIIIPAVYDHLERYAGEIIACVDNTILQTSGRHHRTSSQGTLEGHFCSIHNSKWAVLDSDGTLLTPYVYDEVSNDGDVIYLGYDGDSCYIDNNFNEKSNDDPTSDDDSSNIDTNPNEVSNGEQDDLDDDYFPEYKGDAITFRRIIADDAVCTPGFLVYESNGRRTKTFYVKNNKVRKVFAGSYINDFNPDIALNYIFGPYSGVVSGYAVYSDKGDIKDCIQQLTDLEAFEHSVTYVVKIAIAKDNSIPKNELLGFWNAFDIPYFNHIGICYDEKLSGNEVRILMLTSYTTIYRSYPKEEINYYKALDSCSVDEIKKATANLEKFLDINNPNFNFYEDDESRKKLMAVIKEDVRIKRFLHGRFFGEWDVIKPAHEYLLKEGFSVKSSLWYLTNELLEILSEGGRKFNFHCMKEKANWLIANGSDLNFLSDGATPLNNLLCAMKYAVGDEVNSIQDENPELVIKDIKMRLQDPANKKAILSKVQIESIMDIYDFLRSKGAKHACELDHTFSSWAPDIL